MAVIIIFNIAALSYTMASIWKVKKVVLEVSLLFMQDLTQHDYFSVKVLVAVIERLAVVRSFNGLGNHSIFSLSCPRFSKYLLLH